jgi:hypothetical protein
MNSQEELIGCLWQLTEALAPNGAPRPSTVRDGDVPSPFCPAARGRVRVRRRKIERAPVQKPEPL